MLATGPKMRDFKPGQRGWILKAIKIHMTTSLSLVVDLWHVNEPNKCEKRRVVDKIQWLRFATHVPPASLLDDSSGKKKLPENSGG